MYRRPTSVGAMLWSVMAIILVPVCFASVPGYPVVQFLALRKLRGSIRVISALPLLFMVPVYGFCLYALTRQSNLWPFYAIVASPVALLITAVVLWIGVRRLRSVGAT